MAKADYDDSLPADFESAEEFDNDFIPNSALPLCAKCLKPCNPLQYYCDKCDSYDAINPLTPYIDFVNIWFYFDLFLTMWRKIWGEDEKPIIIRLFYLLFLVAFYPIMFVFGVLIYLIFKIPQRQVRNAILALFVLALIGLLILWPCSGRQIWIF